MQMTKAGRIDLIEETLRQRPDLSIRDIATRCQSSQGTVIAVARAIGIARKGRTPQDVQERILQQLETTARKAADIGQQFGVSEHTVRRIWARNHPDVRRTATFFVQRALELNPAATPQQLEEITGLERTTLYEARKALGLVTPRGKMPPMERCVELVAAYPADVSNRKVAAATGLYPRLVADIRRAERSKENAQTDL